MHNSCLFTIINGFGTELFSIPIPYYAISKKNADYLFTNGTMSHLLYFMSYNTQVLDISNVASPESDEKK